MIKEDLIKQLQSIIEDKKHFVNKDDSNDIFKKDIEAIKQAIFYVENFEAIKEITQTFPATEKDNFFVKEMPYDLIIASKDYFLNGIFTEHFISKDKIREIFSKYIDVELQLKNSYEELDAISLTDVLQEILEGKEKTKNGRK